jgi:hypothetical protein
MGAEIVNTGYAQLKGMPIEPVYIDHCGDLSVAQSLAQRNPPGASRV